MQEQNCRIFGDGLRCKAEHETERLFEHLEEEVAKRRKAGASVEEEEKHNFCNRAAMSSKKRDERGALKQALERGRRSMTRLPDKNANTQRNMHPGTHPSKCDGRPEGPRKVTVRRNMERLEPV